MFVDLTEFNGSNPEQAIHGCDVDVFSGLRGASPAELLTELQERLDLGVPPDAHFLGIDDLLRLEGTATDGQLAELQRRIDQLSGVISQAGGAAILGTTPES